jgi:hypothetical protein
MADEEACDVGSTLAPHATGMEGSYAFFARMQREGITVWSRPSVSLSPRVSTRLTTRRIRMKFGTCAVPRPTSSKPYYRIS